MGLITVEGKGEVEIEEGVSAKEVSSKLSLTAPDQALAVQINGTLRDLASPLQHGDKIRFLSFDEPLGKEVFWHTSAHVLAQAILRLFPDAKPTIGPPIEHGFYYDFADLHISEEDFPRIEEEMRAIAKENYTSRRETFASKAEAIELFKANPYKVALIEGFEEGGELSGYRQGEFFDLCRGPHLPNVGKIKALKVTKVSGAYWRGDAKNEMLTRIYAITFPDREGLKNYLYILEEAKRRDHKIIGPKLGLFSLLPEAPGLPFIHPKGMIIWNRLIDLWRDLHTAAGYAEIKTPSILTRELWETSGHWSHYKQNMYTCEIDKRDFAIKPMNCPGCALYFKGQTHSYRDLPLRLAEIGHVHRYEAHGALSGLFRVRGFHQDDAHLFITKEQIQQEISALLKLADTLYTIFGIEYKLELSTRPAEGTIGSDEDWESATAALKRALDSGGHPYIIREGEGAFYGPKIDFHLRDALGRSWQCGTIQLDMNLPVRFNLEYTDQDGSRKRPLIIHRALYGSIERFFGSLIELYAGRFPLWLSPREIRILTVADRHTSYANELCKRLQQEGFLVEVDESSESVSKKVRAAQLDQVNYILTVGDKEMEHRTLALRCREGTVYGELNLEEFLATLQEEKRTRSLKPYY